MYLTLEAINQDATLNNFFNIGTVRFIKDKPLIMVLRLIDPAKKLRYIPEAASTLSISLKKSDNTVVTKAGSFPFVDDRSIIKFEFTALEMANVVSQTLVVDLTEPVAGASCAIINAGLQLVVTEGC